MNFHVVILLMILVIVLAPTLSLPNSFAESKSIENFRKQDYQIYEFSNRYGHFNIPYKITNGTIEKIIPDFNKCSMSIYLKTTGKGMLSIVPPKIGYTHVGGGIDWKFIDVLYGGKEIDRIVSKDGNELILSTSFQAESSKIELYHERMLNQYSDIPCRIAEHDSTIYDIFPPKKQLEYGMLYSEIFCDYGLTLIFKSTNDSPACVKPESIPKLVEHGWGSTSIQN